MKHIELTHAEWDQIRDRIREDFGFSMPLLRDKMKRELGFTVREHRTYDPFDPLQLLRSSHRIMICLDFYDEQMKTWFSLKYL
jgi:hypothetical protein